MLQISTDNPEKTKGEEKGTKKFIFRGKDLCGDTFKTQARGKATIPTALVPPSIHGMKWAAIFTTIEDAQE